MDDGRRDEHGADEVRALEERVYGSVTPDPRDVARLRELRAEPPARGALAPRGDSHASPPDSGVGGREGADPGVSAGPAVQHRPPRRSWLAGGVAAVLVAGLIGAGVTQAALSGGSAAPSPAVTSTTPMADVSSISETLGAEYFDQKQDEADVPDISLPRIDPTSTRRVLAQFDREDHGAALWVARGTDGSFCLILSVSPTQGASSCTPRGQAAATGVRLDLVVAGGGSISARWNISAGILELSPFPAEAGDATATPTP